MKQALVKQLRDDWPYLAWTGIGLVLSVAFSSPPWVAAVNGISFGVVLGASIESAMR